MVMTLQQISACLLCPPPLRCFFSINPEKGTKVVKTSSRLQVNPRVLTLIQDLADHEWCNA